MTTRIRLQVWWHVKLIGILFLAPASCHLADAMAADPGVFDDRIVIGSSTPLSGSTAQLGSLLNTGVRAHIEQVNRQGGINGRRIELRTIDDQYDPEKAVANTRRLIETDRVFALLGYVGTASSNAVLPIITDAKVPFIGPLTGAMSVREPGNRYVFNVRASYADEIALIVNQLVSTGTRKIGVVYQNDAFGKSGLEAVARFLAERRLSIHATGSVERGSTDVTQVVADMRANEPEAIVLILTYAPAASFIKAMRKVGYMGQFHNLSAVGSTTLAETLGTDGIGIAITQVVPFPWAGAAPVVREYQKAMQELGQKDYDFTSLEGYIGARVLVEGLRRAGRDLSRERLVGALETLNRFDIGGLSVTYAPGAHSGSRFVDTTIIGSSGRFIH
jgi:ABC-type branched-subunit amino acid transport system substrate-binding protein